MRGKSKKGTWLQALGSLFGAVLFIMCLRWAFFEPYVIPSGSMIPNLLVHDFILVNKFSYGVRIPFTSEWLMKFGDPKRGDVVVFKSKNDSGHFLVKRVVGLPGDNVEFNEAGELMINGDLVSRAIKDSSKLAYFFESLDAVEKEEYKDEYNFYLEVRNSKEYVTILDKNLEHEPEGPFVIPEGQMMMVGDNRDNSVDSRSWGFVPFENILGRAAYIWMSCSETLEGAPNICHPNYFRWNRMFKRVE